MKIDYINNKLTTFSQLKLLSSMASHRLEPMKPALPVTRNKLLLGN